MEMVRALQKQQGKLLSAWLDTRDGSARVEILRKLRDVEWELGETVRRTSDPSIAISTYALTATH